MKALIIASILLLSLCAPLFAEVQWTATATGAVVGEPVLLSDRAIFATYDGRIYAYSLSSGTILWTFDAGNKITQGAELASPDRAAAVTIDGTVFILGTADGKLLSETPLGMPPIAFSSSDGRVYVGHPRGAAAVSSAGRALWNFTANGTMGQIGSGSGKLYFTLERRLYALVGTSGAVKWSSEAEGSFVSRPYENGGRVYLGSTDGKLYSFDSESGSADWSFKTGGWVMSTPLMVSNAIFFASNDGYAYSLTRTGQFRFKVPLQGEVWTQMVSYEQNGRTVVVFATTEGKLHGMDSQTGEEAWVFQSYGRPEGMAIAGRSIVFGTDKGKTYSLSTESMCGFSWPHDLQLVGGWPLEVEGKAIAEGGVSQVEVRVENGPWRIASGTEQWHATIDLTEAESGAVNVQCRARGSGPVQQNPPEYSTLSLIKSDNAPPLAMFVSAPPEAEPDERITVSAQDTRGMDLRRVNITVDGNSKIGDSPFGVVLGRSGPAQITLQKPGYETAVLVVTGRGDGGLLLPAILAGFALLAAAMFLLRKRLLALFGR